MSVFGILIKTELMKLLSITDWDDYFDGYYTEYRKITAGIYTGLTGNVYIFESLFDGLSGSSGGSVYYSSSSDSKMLIEDTTFIKSTSSSKGGAIFFGNEGQYVASKVCSYGCSSSNGLFEYIEITSLISCINQLLDSSICSSYSPNSYNTNYIYYGKILIKNNNISNNNCIWGSAERCNPSSNGDNIACSIKLVSFVNNTSNRGSIICICDSYFSEMNTCNLISNINTASDSSSNYIILNSGKTNINNSCIINNSAVYLFRNSNVISLTNCVIDHDYASSGTVVIYSTPKTSFINKIKLINTALCYASYDSYKSLTVIPETITCNCPKLTCNNHYKAYNRAIQFD